MLEVSCRERALRGHDSRHALGEEAEHEKWCCNSACDWQEHDKLELSMYISCYIEEGFLRFASGFVKYLLLSFTCIPDLTLHHSPHCSDH